MQVPGHRPKVIAANAIRFSHVERNPAAALPLFRKAVDAGLNDSNWLGVYGDLLGDTGNPPAAMAMIRRAVELDYENPVLQQLYLPFLMANGDFDKAQETLAFYLDRRPDDMASRAFRAVTHGYLTGDLGEWRQMADSAEPFVSPNSDLTTLATPSDADLLLHTQFEWLRIDHRYEELLRMLEQYPSSTLRPNRMTAGLQPKASLTGWVHLLMGNSAEAAQSGAEIAEFLASTEVFPQHRIFRKLMATQAAVMQGQYEQAIALTDELDRELPPFIVIRTWLPILYAWAGAKDKAVAMLETMTQNGGARIVPGRVALEPLLTVPLADHAGFQQLKARMEQEMRDRRQASQTSD